ncbi:MAG: four helix bundle protein [bacterium]|nr:four helix bundle protein [bacterium]
MENRFEKLEVWKKAHQLVLLIYKVTQHFPREEKYGLVDQMRRAGVSIVANIVEGNIRQYKKEFLQFLYVSKGSLEELRYFTILSYDLKYISLIEKEELTGIQTECGKLLNGFIKYLKS